MKWFKRQSTLHQATAEAARALSGNMTETEARRINRWAQSQAEHKEELAGTLRMMAEMESLAGDPDINALLNASGQQTGRHTSKWPILAAAAGILMALMVGLGLQYMPQDASHIIKYVTKIGEQKTVTLQDGSMVTLNTGTQLLVDYSEDSRRVLLERGEAWFDVASDANRPFSVNLGEYTVTVLGTAFNLLKSPEKFTLAVVEGQVAVHGADNHADTAARVLPFGDKNTVKIGISGQKIVAGTVAEYSYQRGELIAYRPNDMSKLYSWRSGLLSFEKAQLGEVVEELNRYTNKKILIRDSELMDVDVYATIRLDQVAQALEGLEVSLPIKVISFYDRYIIVSDQETK